MPQTIVVRTQAEQDRLDYASNIGFLIILGVILIALIIFGAIAEFKKNPVFVILALTMVILFLFRKKIFKGSGKVRQMRFKDSLKVYLIYFLVYTIGLYLYLNYVAVHINNNIVFLSYLYLGIALTILGKLGGLIINKKLILNKQTLIWIPVYMLISYVFLIFIFEFLGLLGLRFPLQDTRSIIILGIWITLTSRVAWNCIYRRY